MFKREQDLNFFYSKKYNDRLSALNYWFNKNVSIGLEESLLIEIIQEKLKLLSDKIFLGYEMNIEGTVVLIENKFYRILFEEFQRKEKFLYKNFISSTIKNIEIFKQKSGQLGRVEDFEILYILKTYSSYNAFNSFLKSKENTEKKTIVRNFEGSKNVFNKMPLEMVYNYFLILSQELNNNKKPYLKEEEVYLFVIVAFTDSKQPYIKPRINIGTKEISKVVHFFKEFYNKCTSEYKYEDTLQVQLKYRELLSNYFLNFNLKQVSDKFSYTPNSKIKTNDNSSLN